MGITDVTSGDMSDHICPLNMISSICFCMNAPSTMRLIPSDAKLCTYIVIIMGGAEDNVLKTLICEMM